MPEKIDLPDGEWAEIRSETTGGDEKFYMVTRDKLIRANGTGKPGYTAPDPENPSVMKEFPAVEPELTAEDTYALLDAIVARLLLSSSVPGLVPWTADVRETTSSGIVRAVDAAVNKAVSEMFAGPKPTRSGTTSASTSGDDADAPRTEPTPEPSVTASG